ncbi:16 kDa phloem protein 1 isoform X1 [Salvia divinorum]|uniref:16 kDa phloem protein 1 isoform X1 n=1 Tax=Salvia divinorum TaxID=28513 RepID=A0ABD1GDK7_SALDI
MGVGVMEVKLIGAKGLKRTDFLGKIDPYVVIQFRDEEYTSTTAKGRRPVWNEEFKFRVELPSLHGSDDNQNNYKIFLRVFDRDTCRKDDFLGQSTVRLINRNTWWRKKIMGFSVGEDICNVENICIF